MISSVQLSPNMYSPAVSILEPEGISPMMLANNKDVDDGFSLDRSAPKQRRAKVAGRLVGRQSDERLASLNSRSPFLAPISPKISDKITASPGLMPTTSAQSDASDSGSRGKSMGADKELYGQIRQWLEAERSRKAHEKSKKKARSSPKKPSDVLASTSETHSKQADRAESTRERRDSDASEGTAALDKLEELLDKSMILDILDSPRSRRNSRMGSRKGSLRRMRRMSTTGTTSDTDYFDGVPAVPSCDAVIDNSKTLEYAGGASDATLSPDLSRRGKEMDAWASFKYEIVRLTHTLRLKGWRRVSMEDSSNITVERFSGALTNAVYLVVPPKNCPPFTPRTRPSDKEMEEYESGRKSKPPPIKLLLRIYGPNVDHLIDRESELAILRRLAHKHIGPRLLGTFSNGRFEEYLHAKALKPQDLRNKQTSLQIAKRFRELHDGIELLEEERESGPFVWRNWDKWADRCALICQHVDQGKLHPQKGSLSRRRNSKIGEDLLCGVTWGFFHTLVEKYRKWLEEHYGGYQELKKQLVFCHNDSQYGNILRVEPPGDSPLLKPANHHKQLVVIDFEYSNANMPGFEFANHFTEWGYNYHDEAAPYACNTTLYPSFEEQRRFIEAYVRHRPQYRAPSTPGVDTPSSRSGTTSDPATKPATPRLAHNSSTSSLGTFLLDARTPAGATPLTSVPSPGQGALDKAVEEEEKAIEAEVQRLLHETKLWRLASSAQWVAWGIVQAKVADLPPEVAEEDAIANGKAPESGPGPNHSVASQQNPADPMGSDPLDAEGKAMKEDLEAKRPDEVARPEEEEPEGDQFDYLAFAHQRALFFLGDAVQMGLVKEEQLPVELKGKLKFVEY